MIWDSKCEFCKEVLSHENCSMHPGSLFTATLYMCVTYEAITYKKYNLQFKPTVISCDTIWKTCPHGSLAGFNGKLKILYFHTQEIKTLYLLYVCICVQLGCCHALWMLSDTYSVVHYAGVWGCSRPAAATASLTGSMTASMRKHGRTHRSVLIVVVVTAEFSIVNYTAL